IAPWREWEFKGRADLIAYAEAHRIPVAATAEKPYSTDRNLLHVSYEGGILEDPWRPPYEDMFQLTVAPERAPERPEDVDVDLEGGTPVAVNGAARVVTGTARIRLYRGSVRTVGRKAPRSLYDPQLVSFDEAGGYRQEDAGGFIRLAGLRLRLRTLVEQTRK